jgi:surface antigen
MMNKENGNSTSKSDDLMKELDAKWDALENDPEFQKKPIWQKIVEIGKVVPQEEWRKQLPTDFARNFEHYMYGAPREEDEE